MLDPRGGNSGSGGRRAVASRGSSWRGAMRSVVSTSDQPTCRSRLVGASAGVSDVATYFSGHSAGGNWENWVYLSWVIGVWLVLFTVSMLAIAVLLIMLPSTYFLDSHRRDLWVDRHRAIRWTGIVLKNLAGISLLLLGAVLSVPGVPGQGLLTILLGVVLLDLPGKRRLERAILSRPRVRGAVDRLRHRFGRAPFVLLESAR